MRELAWLGVPRLGQANAYLAFKRLMPQGSTIVDATNIAAPLRTKNAASERDTEMR